MSNPPLTVTLDPVLLDSLEAFVRTQAAYMGLPQSALHEQEGRKLAGQGAQAAVAVTQALLKTLPAAGLGSLGEALAELSAARS
ncbi:hypothetical protein [Pseudomonas fluorescens]|uniref:hypothetical protein n=1 Tax=Pseudomonas fluorescens TaxID=294 RepID=UPI0010D4FFF5|nr:hypothetical protein [Pseudomonas fluorescens]TCV62712.1 hypothetical protein EDB98_11220 [Pseudomonas fluorescens]